MSAFGVSFLILYSHLFFFLIIISSQDRLAVECLVLGGNGVCTRIGSYRDIYPSLRVQAQKVQFSKPCGWNTCNSYKIVFVPVYYADSRVAYRQELVCCPGYESIDNNHSCQDLLILGGTEPPNRPGRPGQQGGVGSPGTVRGPGQPNGPGTNGPAPRVPPINPNAPTGPGNPNVPSGPGLPGGRGNAFNPLGPNSNSPSSPGSNSNPSLPGNGFPNVPNEPLNPLAPVSPNAPNRPVQPGSPGRPGPTSNGPIGPGGPEVSGKPVGPVSPSSPGRPGSSYLPNGPVIPDTVPGSQTEGRGPFNPYAPVDPQYPFDPNDPVFPREDPMNRGGSNPRIHPTFGQDGKIPDSHGNSNQKDTKYESGYNDKEENYAPSDSKGSVMVIFGVLMLVMALFGLGALGMVFMRKRVHLHEELEEETPRTSYSFSRWSRYWTGKFRIESFYMH